MFCLLRIYNACHHTLATTRSMCHLMESFNPKNLFFRKLEIELVVVVGFLRSDCCACTKLSKNHFYTIYIFAASEFNYTPNMWTKYAQCAALDACICMLRLWSAFCASQNQIPDLLLALVVVFCCFSGTKLRSGLIKLPIQGNGNECFQ